MHKPYSDFVCAYCFNKLEECTCKFNVDKLIQIDEGIQYAIRGLNQNGWFTKFSCEGHYNEEAKKTYVDITFDGKDYTPSYFPQGWIVNQSRDGTTSIYGEIKFTSTIAEKKRKQFETNKAQRMKELNDWVDSLPFNPNC